MLPTDHTPVPTGEIQQTPQSHHQVVSLTQHPVVLPQATQQTEVQTHTPQQTMVQAPPSQQVVQTVHPTPVYEPISPHKTGQTEPAVDGQVVIPVRCYACGETGHYAAACKSQNKRSCYLCHQTGHYPRTCPNKGMVTLPDNQQQEMAMRKPR